MINENIINIFKSECNYKRINDISNVKLRNTLNGVLLTDAIYYRFSYADKYKTKEQIVSTINNIRGTHFTRQGIEAKENSIPINTYTNVLKLICDYYSKNYVNKCDAKLIGVDGTYNNDRKMREELNMGFYDITNGIPIDIKSFGVEGKNREIKTTTSYIETNVDAFRNAIIVGDRAYFSYAFMAFLISLGIKFIIRAKGNAVNLNLLTDIRKTTSQYDLIMKLRNNIRIVKCESVETKTIFSSSSKGKTKKNVLEIRNDCVIITNLLDENKYPDNEILNMYKSRWDIEVFFKFIKSNYKFQHIKEKHNVHTNKMYICELIITYIAKILENHYINKFKNNIKFKINKSNLIRGIFSSLLYDILNNKLNNEKLDHFCKSYIKVIINGKDRTFPRTSKTPFSKWYVKGYSNQTKYITIIDAIINKTVDKLKKNLKTIANKIITIDK